MAQGINVLQGLVDLATSQQGNINAQKMQDLELDATSNQSTTSQTQSMAPQRTPEEKASWDKFMKLRAEVTEKALKKGMSLEAEQQLSRPGGVKNLLSASQGEVTPELEKMQSEIVGAPQQQAQTSPQVVNNPNAISSALAGKSKKGLWDIAPEDETYGQTVAKTALSPIRNPIQTLKNVVTFLSELDPVRHNAGASARETEQAMRGETPLQAKDILAYNQAALKNAKELEAAGSLTPQNLYSEFNKASGEFSKVRDAQVRVETSAKDPSPAGDLALIFNFMKVLDPGSTVREGEFANAQNSGSIGSKMTSLYNSVVNGKRLSEKQRADFVSRSRKLFKGAEQGQEKLVEEFKGLASRNGIDWKKVIIDKGIAQDKPKGIPDANKAAQAKQKGATGWDSVNGVWVDAQGNPIQ